jgi:hypothetical protein
MWCSVIALLANARARVAIFPSLESGPYGYMK